ncbi:MAG: biotin--[acetyl-CoA-carboxylase] ligase [Eggerthella lenta]
MEAGEPEGLVVRALRQVSGYGRQGRSWTSPEGGLYCSLLLRPQVAPRELPTLSLVVGMAVRRALVALAGARAEEAVRIKWPNDLVLAQKARYARFPEATEIRDLGFSESGKELGRKIVHSGYFVPTKAMLAVRETAERLISRSFAASRSSARRRRVRGRGRERTAADKRPDVGKESSCVRPTSRIPLPRRPSLSKQCSKRSSPPSRRCTVYGGATCLHRLDEFNAYSSLNGQNVRMVDRADNLLAKGGCGRRRSSRLVLRSESGIETAISSGEAHLV